MRDQAFRILYHAFSWLIILPFLFLMSLCARVVRLYPRRHKPRLLWAGAPMPSLITASNALKMSSFDSLTVVNQRNSNTYNGQFDVMLMSEVRLPKGLNAAAYLLRCVIAFTKSLFTRDILHSFFNGGILGNTTLLRAEAFLWKLSGGKLILFAYGQDGFVYSSLPDEEWANALKSTYPRTPKQDRQFAKRIYRLSKIADCVVGCVVHTVTLPRVDIWPVLWYPAPDLSVNVQKNPSLSTMKIAHPTNHRAIKGTNSLIEAVEDLKSQGLDISLDVIENVDVRASRDRLAQADIVVDQLLMGYAMTALEGLALGKVVISGIDSTDMYKPFYEKSYLQECPIVRANPKNIAEVIKYLYENNEEQESIKQASLSYKKFRHSSEACSNMFNAIYEKIYYNHDVNLSQYYSPV